MGPNDVISLAVNWCHWQLNIWTIFTSSFVALVCLFIVFINVELSVKQYDSLLKQKRKQQYISYPDTGNILHLHMRDLEFFWSCIIMWTCFNYQLNAQFIYTIIYIYIYIITLDMFRAIPCSSSGGQIVFLQHLLSLFWK